jgi:hypothetical protein
VVPLRKKLIKGDDKSDVPSDFFAERNCREKDAVTAARFCNASDFVNFSVSWRRKCLRRCRRHNTSKLGLTLVLDEFIHKWDNDNRVQNPPAFSSPLLQTTVSPMI